MRTFQRMDTKTYPHGYSADLAGGGSVEVDKITGFGNPYWAVFLYEKGRTRMQPICLKTHCTYREAMTEAWRVVRSAERWNQA